MKRFTVKEVVGQEYYYSVMAENGSEAIEKVKNGEAGTATRTNEARPTYEIRSTWNT